MRCLTGFGAAALLATIAHGAQPHWSAEEIATIKSMWIGTLGPLPPDPSNRFADDAAAASLGRMLFADARLSANGKVSCASCHQPAEGFVDRRPTGRGIGAGTRRTMPIAQSVRSPWLFWDGRADSLWAQALGPIENPAEHGFTRRQVAEVVIDRYRLPYEAIFGPVPVLSDQMKLDLRAGPNGTAAQRAAWNTFSRDEQEAVNRVYANVGKAIAAYERTLVLKPTKFDRFAANLGHGAPSTSFSPAETAGLRLFIGKARCSLCHSGPLLSNEGFANTGVPSKAGLPRDLGRFTGALQAQENPFNCRGRYSDAGDQDCDEFDFLVTGDNRQVRAFKVPSLRSVGQRAPYMHAGQFASLTAVIDHYNRAPRTPLGVSELKPLHLTAAEKRNLKAFLRTLDEPQPPNKDATLDR